MTKQQIDQLVSDEISNFIEYWTSNEAERVQMHSCLQDYMSEVYETPTYNVDSHGYSTATIEANTRKFLNK